MLNVMVDIETLGTRVGSVVTAIGACMFNERGIIDGPASDLHYHMYYHTLLIQPQLDVGMTVDSHTLEWWLQQSAEARAEMSDANKKVDPYYAIQDFLKWWPHVEGVEVWCNGLNFDVPCLEALFRKCGLGSDVPWKYNAGRDTRTLFGALGIKMGYFQTPEQSKHHALYDAIFQAKETVACMKYMSDHFMDRAKAMRLLLIEVDLILAGCLFAAEGLTYAVTWARFYIG